MAYLKPKQNMTKLKMKSSGSSDSEVQRCCGRVALGTQMSGHGRAWQRGWASACRLEAYGSRPGRWVGHGNDARVTADQTRATYTAKIVHGRTGNHNTRRKRRAR